MTRIFYDSDNPADIPDHVQGVMGYIDGYAAKAWNGPQGFARFRALGIPIITIAVNAAHDADMLDVESGDATPEQAPGWVQRQRQRGNANPIVYCAESTYQAVRNAFHSAGIPEPVYVLAAYPGTAPHNGPVIYPWPNVIGHQYADPPGSGGHFDLSAMADHIPGVDPDDPPEDDLASLIFSDSPFVIPPGETMLLVPPDGGDAVPHRWVSLFVTCERKTGEEVVARVVINTANGPKSPPAFGAGIGGDTSVGFLIPDKRGNALTLDLSDPVYGSVQVQNQDKTRDITARIAYQATSF